MKLRATSIVFIGLVIGIFGGATGQAQTVIQIQDVAVQSLEDPFGSTEAMQVSPATAQAAGTQPAAAVDEASAEETLLFTEMQKLKYDRRPSMILRAWAELEAAPPEAASEPSPDEASTAQETPAAASPAAASPTADLPDFDPPPQPMTAAEVAAREARELAEKQQNAIKTAQRFQRLVTVGKWEQAAEILRQLKLTNQRTIYRSMLTQFVAVRQDFQQLANVEGLEQGNLNNQQFFEKNRFTIEDMVGLLAMAPESLTRTELVSLGQINRMILDSGVDENALAQRMSELVSATPDADRLPPPRKPASDDSPEATTENAEPEKPGTEKPKAKAKPVQPWLTRRQAAWLALYSNQLKTAESFLPSAQDCQANHDAEGLNLIARLTLSKSLEDAPDKLNDAWKVLQIVIESDDVPVAERNEALLRAVSLVPKLDEAVGEQWLETLFAGDEGATREIMAVMGERVSRGMQALPHDPDTRGDALEMMKVATRILLDCHPDLESDWQDIVNLLATSWLREAQFSQQYDTSTSLGPQLQRDQYGNFYYYDPYQYMRQRAVNSSRQPTPIGIERILETIPEDQWFENLDPALKPEVSLLCANLLLKVNEEERAFPYIESLAGTHQEKAQELAEQFLRVWTQNHDMNASRGNNRYSPYYYAYGFNQSAESIPLTRSKQERNLKDLTKWVAALRDMPQIEVDQELLANAFTTCHSGAEVYRFDEIETVFGPMQQMDPDVLAALCEKMRTNLAGQWQIPDLQKQNNTKRTKKDIQQLVLDGYRLAMDTVNQAIDKHPDNWRLRLQQACLLFDDNEYRSVLQNRNEYSQQKSASYAAFSRAAQAYAESLKDANPNDYSTDVYEKWFYAMLGNTNLAKIDENSAAQTSQTQLILAAIQNLGDALAEEHLKLFSNVVVTRVGMANPAVKFTFLTEGFKITGDRPEVTQARRLHEYYRDLVTELELEAVLDGDDQISASQPFGVYIRINHTPELERESGGFGRFLQNQSTLGYAYNYGRPPADYRDRFETAARQTLEEHFEVLSVTFQRETVRSQPLNQPGHPGWKTTPYAYLLLKAVSPSVDRLPAIRMDLDFLDTTGYIVLPIQTAEIPLANQPQTPAPRPFRDLQVRQTLDQREGQVGKLTLEVKASCSGLVPDLEQIMQLDPAEFEIVEMEDSMPMVTAFEKDSDEMTIVSERTWEIQLRGKDNLSSKPDQFQFGTKREDTQYADWSMLGFVDEDVVDMEPVVTLTGDYGEAATPWTAIVTFVSVALLGVVVLSLMVVGRGSGNRTPQESRIGLDHSPFALIAALSQKLESGQLDKRQEAELREEIHNLEQSYFADHNAAVSDGAESREAPGQLKSIASRWL